MSWQAMSAVNTHSQQTHLGRFRLLLYLADHADANGRIDPAPNQATQAEQFDCTKRTIRAWIGALVESGELTQTRIGSGPGNPSAFQINLPMPTTEKAETDGGKAEDLSQMEEGQRPKAEANPVSISAFAELKAEIQALKAEVSTLKAEMGELKGGKAEANPISISAFVNQKAEGKGGKGGKAEAPRRKRLSTESAHDPLDPYLIQKGISPQTPLTAVEERVSAILDVCGLDRDIPAHLTAAENAAVQLDKYSANDILHRYSPGTVPNGSWYWYRDDWRGKKGQQPTPKDVTDTIAKAFITPLKEQVLSKPAVSTGLVPDSSGLM